MPVSVEDFEKYKKERGGLSPKGFEAYKESLAVTEKPKEISPGLIEQIRGKLPFQKEVAGFLGGVEERGLPLIVKGLEKWRETDYPITKEMTQIPGSEFFGMTENERYIANIGRTVHALPRFPIDIAQKVLLTEGKEIGRDLPVRPPLKLGKEILKTAGEFAEWGRGVFEDYSAYVSPLSTPKQRRQAVENIATDPGGLFFVTGIIKGGIRGAGRLKVLVKRVRQKKGMSIEEPPVEKVPAITEEQIAKEMPKKEPIPGKAEMKLARELKVKGVTEKPVEVKLTTELPESKLKVEATEMLQEAELIRPPSVRKGARAYGVQVAYDPATTPEWFPDAPFSKTEAVGALKSIAKDGLKAKNPNAQSMMSVIEKWAEEKYEVREYPKVFGGELKAGDRVKIKGEWYTAKPSPETGEVRLVDGKQIKLDVFEDIPVEEIRRVTQEGRVAPEGEAVISQLYKEGREAQKAIVEKGEVTIPLVKTPALSGIVEGIKNKIHRVQEGFRKFKFYPKAPAELRNDIRTGPVQIYRDVFTKRGQLETAILGGLDKAKIQQTTQLIFARDAVARTKANAGKPGVTLEEVTQELARIEKSITDPKIIKAADNYKKISDIYRDELVRREKLEPGQFFEDYAPHLVEDYTPEWAPTFGIPRKMRIPYRPYTKKAVGTTKAYRQNPDVLLDHLAKIEWDNLMEDWLIGQAKKYDITPSLPREQKVRLFGTDKAGRVRPWARSGRIIDIEGKRYRAFSPTKPFTRQLFPTEEGTLMALGREKRTYLVPEDVYNTFERFSEPGGGSLIYAINRANAYGKSLAILSHFTSFNFNNFVGDAFLGILQHPKKIQFLRNLDDGFRFLVKSPEKYSPYEAEFSKFLTDHAIVDATFIKELPYIYRSKNPLKKILAKSQEVSQFRESIQRIANAKYLFDELKAGRGDQVKQQWDWINTEGLPTEKALGKIGRDSYVDYMAQSKTYNRWIRGFFFPFGTWYFKMSRLVHKMGLKHPIKVGIGLSALPTLAVMFNNRNDEIREMERMLPEFIRDNRVHFVLGKRPDGTIRTLVLQTPQDALIGTKIFTIAINQANQVLNGEKSIQRGAIDTIKNWGIVEGRGILYLTTPVVRFLRGLIDGRDPYDKQRLYPINVSKLSASQEWWHRFVYAQKCFMPFLTGYIAETEGRLKPKGRAVKDVINNFIGLPAFGIRDYNERTQVVLPGGGVIDWDTFSELEKVEQKEASIMLDIKQQFIKSGLMPQEYYGSEEFRKLLLNLKNLHEENFTKELQQSLSKRIANEIENDPITFKMWAGNRLDMAETDEEKKYWGDVFKKARTMQMLQRLKYKPITVREHLPGIIRKKEKEKGEPISYIPAPK